MTFKEKKKIYIPILPNLFQKMKKEETHLKLLYEANITLLPNQINASQGN